MKTYTLTDQALDDIEVIQDYFLDRRPEFIGVLHSEFLRKFKQVGRFPNSGVDSAHLLRGMRRVFVRDYVVFYRHESGKALIIRVLHGARDIDASLFDGSNT